MVPCSHAGWPLYGQLEVIDSFRLGAVSVFLRAKDFNMNLALRREEHVGINLSSHIENHACNRNQNDKHPTHRSHVEHMNRNVHELRKGTGSCASNELSKELTEVR